MVHLSLITPHRLEDCLRRFVTILCEQNCTAIFCAFPFVGMEEEVAKTLEFKARNSHIFHGTNYYKIIYSFFVNRMNFRRGNKMMEVNEFGIILRSTPCFFFSAASAMYAYICRLEQEVERETVEDATFLLTEMAKSYLAVIHCLSMVHPDSAWLMLSGQRPILTQSRTRPFFEVRLSIHLRIF
jgi:hypothetical protein